MPVYSPPNSHVVGHHVPEAPRHVVRRGVFYGDGRLTCSHDRRRIGAAPRRSRHDNRAPWEGIMRTFRTPAIILMLGAASVSAAHAQTVKIGTASDLTGVGALIGKAGVAGME